MGCLSLPFYSPYSGKLRMAATKDNNSQIPNPPKAMQRGLGLLNPPRVNQGRNSISPPPNVSGDDDPNENVATQRIQVSMLQRNPVEEPSSAEPLVLRNVRLKSGFDDNGSEEVERTQVNATRENAKSSLPKPRKRDARIRAQHRFYDFDEDAITKKIVVNRIVTVSPNRSGNQKPETTVRVESVHSERQHLSTVTDARYNNPMAPERPTDLSALGNATQAANRRRSVIPVLRDGIKKVMALIAPHRTNVLGKPLIEPKDNSYQMGVNSYSADLYKEMRQAIQAGPNAQSSNLPVPRYTYLVSRPPRIVLKGFLLRREKQTSLMLRGRAIHPLSVRDVMIFADKRKILYLSSAARNDAGCIEFSADIPLLTETSHILVVARHNEEVMGSQSLFVKRDQ